MRALIAAAVLSMLVTVSTRAGAGRQVLTSTQLAEAGVGRISDILPLIDGWDLTTVDGFTWAASPLGLSPFDVQQWQILIDSQPIDANAFGSISLNELPLTVGLIDSIEIISLPQLHAGEFASSGMMHFHTRRADEGRYLRASTTVGNESGDPGPFVFTEAATPNVERLGPDASLDGGLVWRGGGVRAGFVSQVHRPVDEATTTRNAAMAASAVEIEASAATVHLALGSWRHRLILSASRNEDFYYFKPYGREIPARRRTLHAGVAGTIDASDRTHIGYRASYDLRDIGMRSNQRNIDFDWRLHTLAANAEIATTRDRYSSRIGIETSLLLPRSAYVITKKPGGGEAGEVFEAAGVYYELDYRLSSRLHYHVDGKVSVVDDRVSPSASLRVEWRPTASQQWVGHVSHAETVPQEDYRIWFWDERGYAFLESNAVTVARDDILGEHTTQTSHVAWSLMSDHDIQFDAIAYYRRFRGLQLERQRFQFESSEAAVAAPVELVSQRGGEIAGMMVRGVVRPGARLETRLSYRYQSSLGGDRDFEGVWATVPEHVIRVSLAYRPLDRFAMRLGIRYRSKTEWNDFADVAAASSGLFASTIDDIWIVDAAIHKRLWGDHLRASVIVHNALDDHVRYHPLGASFALSAFVQLEIVFDSPS